MEEGQRAKSPSFTLFLYLSLSFQRAVEGEKKRIVNSEIFTPFFRNQNFFHVTSQENRKKEKNRHSRKNGRIRCELINFNVSNVMSDEYIRAGLRSIHQESTHPSDFGTIKANSGRILSKGKQIFFEWLFAQPPLFLRSQGIRVCFSFPFFPFFLLLQIKAKQKQDPPPRVEDKNPNCQGGWNGSSLSPSSRRIGP